jgi:hypothetical protein
MMKKLVALLLCIPLGLVCAQTDFNPSNLIGLTLAQLYERYGAPSSVYALRGDEPWQDDVVLVYDTAISPVNEYFVYQDRVWQVGVPSWAEIRVGDRSEALVLMLGEVLEESATEAGTRAYIYKLEGYSWPLSVRFAIDEEGLVSGIYVYRSDL